MASSRSAWNKNNKVWRKRTMNSGKKTLETVKPHGPYTENRGTYDDK